MAFSGVRKVTDGALRDVLPVLKDRFDRDPSELVLVFDVGSGRQGAYRERVEYSRRAFPDLAFTLDEVVTAGERVAVRWSATGTHQGDLRGFPRTGRRLGFAGQTFYEVKDSRIRGHWQVVDRLGFAGQLRR